jgi:4-amino-4-deoxy-L-arabinose transferase-like glycosyltransferase
VNLGDRKLLWIVLILAASLRLLAAVALPDQHFPDADAYRSVAAGLRNLQGFSDPYIMPLYPIVVAVTGAGWGQKLFDVAVSTLTVLTIHQLTLILFKDRLAALLAALAAAIYPTFIFYAVVGLTETLFIALVLAAFLAWYAGRFAIAAVCVILSILTRPTIDFLPPLLIVTFGLLIHRLTLAATARRILAYVLIYCAMLAPWWAHNFETYGAFVRLNLGSGLALYSGNNPNNKSGGVSDAAMDMTPFQGIADPLARDRAMRDAALSYIAEDPPRFFKLAALKFLRFWRLWPFAQSYSGPVYVIASLISFVPILALALAQIATSNRATLVRIGPIVLFAAYLTGIHMVIVGSVRYRLPIEPFLIVLAAPFMARIFGKLTGSRLRSDQPCTV